MKRTTIRALLALAALGAAAGPAAALGPVDVTAAGDYVTRYIWRGYDLVPDNNPAFQPSGAVGYSPLKGLNVSGSVWGSYGMSDSEDKIPQDENKWDEIDYTINVSYAVSDTVSVSVGHIYYFFPQVLDADADDTKEVYTGVSVGLPLNLSTGLKIYYDYDNGKGIYANWTIDYSRKLSDAVSVFSGFNVGYMSYTKDAADGGFYVDSKGDALRTFSDANLGLGLSVDLGHGLSLTNALYYTIPLGDVRDDVNDHNECWGKVSLATAF
ncbi:MAG: hypothetical protein HZB55_10145 [Deltaproteobacteria bacterium]|nr:hypothetical protein [Deltaproteobacteria bacterium]